MMLTSMKTVFVVLEGRGVKTVVVFVTTVDTVTTDGEVMGVGRGSIVATDLGLRDIVIVLADVGVGTDR
jgi:hypothetical protein